MKNETLTELIKRKEALEEKVKKHNKRVKALNERMKKTEEEVLVWKDEALAYGNMVKAKVSGTTIAEFMGFYDRYPIFKKEAKIIDEELQSVNEEEKKLQAEEEELNALFDALSEEEKQAFQNADTAFEE